MSTTTEPTSASSDLLLAVDAGGTKTAVWLVDSSKAEADRILGRGRATAGNPLSVGFEEATRAIEQAIASAYPQAGRPVAPVPRAILSIAGAANHHLGERFHDWARRTGVADHVAVVSDVLPVLAAGTPDCCGVALISGTGSVAFARRADGRTTLSGGWGYLLGDEGSGYDIGRAALRYSLQNLESSAAGKPLAEAVLAAVGAGTVMELTKAIYENPDPRAAIASIAPLVIDAADGGDADALAMLDAAAGELAQLVRRTLAWTGQGEGRFSLAVAGGVLVTSRHVRQQLQTELDRLGLACDINIVQQPLEGCVRLAAPEFAGSLVIWH